MAVAALVLGVVALLTCWSVIGGIVLGILAMVFGKIASGRAKRGEASGRGMAIGGIVTGTIGLVAAVAIVALGASLLNSSSTKNYEHCVNGAGGNQQAIHNCAVRYSHQIRNQYG